MIGLTFTIQGVGLFFQSRSYLSKVEMLKEEGVSTQGILSQLGHFDLLNYTYSLWFVAPIMLGIVALLFYSVFIWYRDWLGKNTFIYRLLLLPAKRMSIYFAKLFTIFLSVLGLVSSQYLFLHVYKWLIPLIISEEFTQVQSIAQVIEQGAFMVFLFPKTLPFFFFAYLTGLMVLMVLFTLILFERSFHLKGILLATGYAGLSLFIYFSPAIYQLYTRIIFANSETFLWFSIMGIVLMGLSILVSNFLLTKKITV